MEISSGVVRLLDMRKVIGYLAVIVLSLSLTTPVQAASIAGSKCAKKDQTKVVGGVKYLCLANGKKLAWSKAPSGNNSGKPAATNQSQSSALVNNDQIFNLPVDAKAPLNLDLKGQGQGDGLTFVPYGLPPGKSRAPGAVVYSGNLQPVFYAAIGTAVLAPVSGKVYKVTKLYSGDYNISFWESGLKYIWEVEHVINVKVSDGEKVVAGQAIAQVSDYDERYTPGIGFVELGVFTAVDGKPLHLCPFTNIASAQRERITNEIKAMVAADTARGYTIPAMAVIGCINTDPIAG
ncbi:MAG: hypothetical protein ACKOVI_00845 [Candidatus Planktophila sp.]